MALHLKFKAREDIPAGLESFYVDRDGAWHLDVEPSNPLSPKGGEGVTAPMVLPPVAAAKPREKRTLADEMAEREADVARMRLEADVRESARRLGLRAKALEDVVSRARCVFRIAEGRPVPVGDDGRTVLRAPDGSRALTVEEWTRRHIEKNPLSPKGGQGVRADAACEDAAMPRRNPFQRKFWNLTEQMRLRKADPEFAAKLKAEAWQEG